MSCIYRVSGSVYVNGVWYLYEIRIKASNQHCFKELLLLTVLVQMRRETQTFSRMIQQSSICQIFTELLHQACFRDKGKFFFNYGSKMTKSSIKLTEHFTLYGHCTIYKGSEER